MVGGVGKPVAPLVEGHDRVAGGAQSLPHPVPEPQVGREPVDEHEGRPGRVAGPPLDVETDAPLHHHACRDRPLDRVRA